MTAKRIWILLFSSCFALFSCESSQGLPGCEVEVQVTRGTVYHASPQELVEVKCPVHHCGKAVRIVWCKWLDKNCTKLSNSEHIQINETMLLDEKLVSLLRFKNISTEDSGLYSCKVKNGPVGHYIYVAVSETDQEEQKDYINSEQSDNGQRNINNPKEDEMKTSSFAFFVIFLSLVLVLFTITIIVLLRKHGKGLLSQHQPPKTQEEQLPSQLIPDLPKRSPPVLSLSRLTVPPPPVPEKTTKDQLQTNTDVQGSKSAVYSEIDRSKSGRSFQNNSAGHSSVTEMKL